MNPKPIYTYLDSPLGQLLVAEQDAQLIFIGFPQEHDQAPITTWQLEKKLQSDAIDQLQGYFAGKLKQFDLSLAPEGTVFQKEVWQSLQTIPYGETISYKTLAERLGKPKAVRAVGAANGKNPLPIVIPCHRVIGSDGSLTGYAGGLSIKRALLELERRHSKHRTQSASLFELQQDHLS